MPAALVKILVLYDSQTGNVEQMARLVVEGAAEIPGVEVRLRKIEGDGEARATPDDVLWADGVHTQTDEVPGSIAADTVGNGSAGSSGNSANYDKDFAGSSGWNGASENVTTVGTNGGPSAYGAFDMAGNIREYNDRRDGTSVGTRGGDYSTFNADNFKPYYSIEFFDEFYYFSGSTFAADSWAPNQGFRLAAIAPVPEPSTCAMAFAGLACGGYLVRRRRKQA